MSARILVGTSSWADPGFVEEWYPEDLPARDRLPYYAERFEAVEVNSTFYAIPAGTTVARWARVTPDGFAFDLKLHRLLSRHAAGLDSLPKALRAKAKTNDRGRVVIDGKLEEALLAETLGWAGPKRVEDTLGWYERNRAVWVGVDAPDGEQITIMPALDAATHPRVAYLRAHGRNQEGYVKGRSVAERFAYRYDDAELEEIAERAQSLAEQVEESVRVYFNNNRGDDAPVAAQRFLEITAGSSAPAGQR